MIRIATAALAALALSGCASTLPASVVGECGVFRDPGRAVMGRARIDQQWIGATQEAGIASCGWTRPKS